MKSKKIWMWIVIVAVIIVAGVFAFSSFGSSSDGNYDNFAMCLTDAGAKMYGAFWCPHCDSQKKEFGASFEHVNYIECSNPDKSQNAECNAAGIESYPTWEFANGQRVNGVIGLNQLGALTGCEAVEDPEA